MQKFESRLGYSNYYLILQIILLLASLATVSYLMFPIMVKVVLMLGLVGYAIRNNHWQTIWQAIGYDSGSWYVVQHGKKIPIMPAGDSLVTSLVVVLRFPIDKPYFKQSCIIFRDAMPADHYREFIVRMRYFNR